MEANKISSTDRAKYFDSGELPYIFLRKSLPTPHRKISSLVKKYSLEIVRRLNQGNLAKVCYAQSCVKEILLPGMIACLHNRKFVEAEHRRPFTLNIRDYDEGWSSENLIVNGVTDHTFKIKSCDCRLLTIEDKSIGEALTELAIAQVRTEMMTELHVMLSYFDFISTVYYGILQNGCEWIFVRCISRNGKQFWNHICAPATIEEGRVKESGCLAVSTLITHVLSVCDQIVEDFKLSQIELVTTTTLKAEEYELDPEKDERSDDDPEVNDRKQQSSSQGGSSQNHSRSFEHANKSNRRKMILPLTQQNVLKLPVSRRYVFNARWN